MLSKRAWSHRLSTPEVAPEKRWSLPQITILIPNNRSNKYKKVSIIRINKGLLVHSINTIIGSHRITLRNVLTAPPEITTDQAKAPIK